LRPQGGELVVTCDSFWYTAIPKHSDYRIETNIQDINTVATFDLADNYPIYIGDDPKDLKLLIEENEQFAVALTEMQKIDGINQV
jgi:hypothetical protein